jgi:ATP-binding cassette, subfamily C (CFTR/MRP), member 1
MGPRRITWNKAIQKRVAVTSNVLSQMKGIKLLGLTERLSLNIQGLRVAELELSKKFRGLMVWISLIGMEIVQLQ